MTRLMERAHVRALGMALVGAVLQGCGGGGGGGGDGGPPPAVAISQISSGGAANCRTGTSGTGCWGQNDVGQLGIGTTTNSAAPAGVVFPGGKTAKQVAQGAEHACAILSDDTVACWGDNAAGQIGQDPATTAGATSPVAVAGVSGAKSVTVGLAHSCVVTANDAVECWGSNSKGQLGQATAGLLQTHLPQAISGVTAKSVVSGFNHVCALKPDDTVACWGDNQYGQLGRGDNIDSASPVAALGLSGVTVLAAGSNHACAATSAKTYCWGRNDAGQLGSNGTTDRNMPTETQTPLAGAVGLAAGQAHTCALTSAAVECWGSNANNQLSGSASGGNARVTVPLGAAPKALSLGLNHSCAQDANDATWCWGAGSMGRLGPNASSDSATPVSIPAGAAN